ncbi:MAG: hypothetical protein NTX64_06970 [Elusimicrobia bacterium]|nr:hypothetical protein [Elusimicrobiota bacterium]
MWVLSLGALLALAGAAYAHGHDAKIAALNAKLKSSNAKWKAGATSISALSDDEFSSSLLSPEDIAASVKSAKSLKKMPPDTMQAAEAAVDWRAKGIETPVRKQGGCGSCWAFAMSGAEEQQLLIKKPGVYRKPGAEVQRSPQALVSCDTQMKGCKGGRLDASYLVGTGLPAESLYPYASGATGEAGACGAGATDQDWKSKRSSTT